MLEKEGQVLFHAEERDVPDVLSTGVKNWLIQVAKHEDSELGNVNVIFCSDAYLYEINWKFLQHDTYTDIVTFDYSEGSNIHGDLFISTDRVAENARQLDQSYAQELHRVIVHGLLHLLGHHDDGADAKRSMREKENQYLQELSLDNA